MKNYISPVFIIVLLAIFSASGVHAQRFQGTAIYQAAANLKGINFNDQGIAADKQKKMLAAIRGAIEKEYVLTFNLTESLWKEVESLGRAPAASTLNRNPARGGYSTSNNSRLYKNTASLKEIWETEFLSKHVLVKNPLETRQWELTNETKQIGDYTAQKAIFNRIFQRTVISFDNDQDQMKTVTDTTQIVAWYTPEIPVSHGPERYWGLPGLILEITDYRTTYLCKKIILNPKPRVKIKVPNKGKEMSRKEMNEILKKKREEMMQGFQRVPENRRGTGN